MVLSSITESAMIPYIPVVYVMPFVIFKINQTKLGKFRVWYYNMLGIDPSDFKRYAIFTSINFIEKFPKYGAGGLGHEVAHLLQTKGEVKVSVELLKQTIDNPVVNGKKEQDAERFYDYFKEPIKSLIKRWNYLSSCKEIKEELIHDAQTLDLDNLQLILLGSARWRYEAFTLKQLKTILRQAKSNELKSLKSALEKSPNFELF